jgi:hypothetical protein
MPQLDERGLLGLRPPQGQPRDEEQR